jgi:alkane 1-monooxygenase
MTFTGQTADGRTVNYTDGKRYYWFFSFFLALVTPVAVGLYFWTGSIAAVFFPLAYMYVFIPLLDLVVGEDTHNPPEEVVEAMANDP